MGAWGIGPTSNDVAADWFGDATSELETKIRNTFKAFRAHKACEEEVRAAALVVMQLCRNYTFGDLELIQEAIDLMTVIKNSDWVQSWKRPTDIVNELEFEIQGLRYAYDHYGDESIFVAFEK